MFNIVNNSNKKKTTLTLTDGYHIAFINTKVVDNLQGKTHTILKRAV